MLCITDVNHGKYAKYPKYCIVYLCRKRQVMLYLRRQTAYLHQSAERKR